MATVRSFHVWATLGWSADIRLECKGTFVIRVSQLIRDWVTGWTIGRIGIRYPVGASGFRWALGLYNLLSSGMQLRSKSFLKWCLIN
jgi:hypothetical protein